MVISLSNAIFALLLLVNNEAPQGALRFAEKEGGPFLREEGGKRIPPLIELPELLSAAEHVVEDKDTEEDLRLLLTPGSSLGGARPKASVIEKDGQLATAKAMCRNRRDYAV
jgi:serine/threonine-protein kinase HipA